MPSPDQEKDKGFDDLMHDLEDNIFGINPPKKGPVDTVREESRDTIPGAPSGIVRDARKLTLPTLVDKATADKILKDFLKEKNQRKYDLMGFELLFKPYWFFTYSAELVIRDENKNVTDAEELSGRIAIDAINSSLADYLQDLLDHEPIEVVDLADELGQVGGESKVIEPKISEDRVERMVQQKIAGVLKMEKENVAVAGFELMWSPVYRYWLTIKKKTHNVQIDGCGGYPVNYDDVPTKEKTWTDVILNDVDLLKDPKKWKEFLKNKRKAVGGAISSKGKERGKGGKSNTWRNAEIIIGPVMALLALYGMAVRNATYIFLGVIGLTVLFWYTNHQRKKPLVPLPPPPFYGPPEGPQ